MRSYAKALKIGLMLSFIAIAGCDEKKGAPPAGGGGGGGGPGGGGGGGTAAGAPPSDPLSIPAEGGLGASRKLPAGYALVAPDLMATKVSIEKGGSPVSKTPFQSLVDSEHADLDKQNCIRLVRPVNGGPGNVELINAGCEQGPDKIGDAHDVKVKLGYKWRKTGEYFLTYNDPKLRVKDIRVGVMRMAYSLADARFNAPMIINLCTAEFTGKDGVCVLHFSGGKFDHIEITSEANAEAAQIREPLPKPAVKEGRPHWRTMVPDEVR